MPNKVSYGPHIFSPIPELYIKTDKMQPLTSKTHKNIRDTLMASFSSDVPDSLIHQLVHQHGIDANAEVKIAFMNYGFTQLVYLATIGEKDKFAASINQPQIPLGKVKEEFENLKRMVEIDPRYVVRPYAHFLRKEKGHELYVSEYIENALCIAHAPDVEQQHGIYDPLPHYHFEIFPEDMSSDIHKIMIAMLVNYYDEERGRGLAGTQISGNDFLLNRDMKIKMIGARKYIEIPFDDYLGLLRKEFVIGTQHDSNEVKSGTIKINHRSKKSMTLEEIEAGIQIGMELRGQNKKKL